MAPVPSNPVARVGLVLALFAAMVACRRPASSTAPAAPPPPGSPSLRQAANPPADSPPPALPDFQVAAVSTQEGKAVWYDVPAGSLAQRRAWPDEMTAASDRLPPNTYVRVTRRENGKSVIVRITDHGIDKRSAIIDLDRSAAEALGMVKAGESQVKLEVLALKNADAAGPPTRRKDANAPAKEPGASATDEKAAAANKAAGGATP